MMPTKRRKDRVILRSIGCNAYEVLQNGAVCGTAFYQKARRRSSVEIWAWVDQEGESTVHLNPGQFDDFRRMVAALFAQAEC